MTDKRLAVFLGGVILPLMKDYLVETVTTGFFSGTLKAAKLNSALNKRAAEGWRLARTIHERKRELLLFATK